MIEASVIGWPINHSRSPLIHGYWLKQYGINGHYSKQAVTPAGLQDFIQSLRHGQRVGANVTLPHKEAALPFVDEADDRVRRIGALNTIWREDEKLYATSTDGAGFLANLRKTVPDFTVENAPVTIFGAGGSARAIVDELLRIGVECVSIHNRTIARAETLADHFGSRVHALADNELQSALADTGLLVNTTSAGMNAEGELAIPWNHLADKAVVADIVYTPLLTPFLATARNRGHAIVPGLGMLLHQAVVGFEKWFGILPEVTKDLHDLVARDIDPDFQP